MNVDQLVRDSLREQAAEQPSVGPGFADRVLAVRRRRRTRTLGSVAAAAAAVVAVAVAVPLVSGRDDVRPARVLDGTGLSAHPDQSPPRDLIAAGDVALGAYYTAKSVPQTKDRAVYTRTYWLLDPRSGRYEKNSKWSFVAVAPGLRTAAVLENDLPTRRIGLLDLTTGRIERWIPVDHGVGGLAFSRDGSRLVATTYDENPDLRDKVHGTSGTDWMARYGGSSRSGFLVVDVASGKGTWSGVAPGRSTGAREDFAFSRDGRLVYSRVVVAGGRDGMQQFYDLEGAKVPAPANELYLRADVGARLSPDGGLAASGLTREKPDKSYSALLDPRTGKRITLVRGAELLAWVDDKRLIAWERLPGGTLYRPQLVLVTIGSDKVVPLSGGPALNSDPTRQSWEPVFAER
ncbi:WD40 repeat domain-containing protein [Streptomyces sp. NPDC051639]|uniref:WD40 repeat domain-containing protein n=1 Tax=Streptomyces sp. NPDC051639 TaxID=3155671 RepID=UPI003441095C